MHSYMTSNGSCFVVTWTIFKNHLLEVGQHKTKRPWHFECSPPFFILFYHVWESPKIERHWNSIWLRAQLDMASQYTWDSMTTLHDFGGILERPLGTFFWALTISWSQLLARVWSGPKSGLLKKTSLGYLWEIKPTCDFARLEVGGFVTRLV